jgi:uncharacterized protein (DUF2267 family)
MTEELGRDDRERAYHAFRAVLHALRDQLTVAEVADLGAQLPLFIRGVYYEGWKPSKKPEKRRKKEEFLCQIAAAIPGDDEIYPEAIAWAAFKVLERHVSSGEIDDVKHALSRAIRSLWPEGRPAFAS